MRTRLRHRIASLAALLVIIAAHGTAMAELEYVEVMTGRAAPTDEVPIVVAIHGLGDRPETFQYLLDDLAAKARLIVPRAPTPYGNDGGAWFEMHSGDEGMSEGISKAAGEIAALATAVREKHGGPARIVVTGFSQGGTVAFALATLRPDLVSAAVPVAGFLPMPMWPAQRPKIRPLPKILALHGEKDQVVPIQSAKWSVEALRSNGFDVQLRSYPGVQHTIDKQERADLHEAVVAAVVELTPKPEQAPPASAGGGEAAPGAAATLGAGPAAAPAAAPPAAAPGAPSAAAPHAATPGVAPSAAPNAVPAAPSATPAATSPASAPSPRQAAQ
ncbi:MAG TPA: alpha/beta fold hydrolase [Candidatus Binatia bacterium]|nr:alpha/beta fold hydrolase [Candidatus Binatia bacterium]